MTSSTNHQILRNVAFAWFKVFYTLMKHGGLADIAEESGYGSDGQKESLIARAEYRIACWKVLSFKVLLGQLPDAEITNSLERGTEFLLQNIKGNGRGYFELAYRVGFSDRLWCFLDGSWQSVTVIGGLCEVLARELSEGQVDFESWKNHSPACEALFTVTIRLLIRETCIYSVISCLETSRNGQLGCKNTPRAITKKPKKSVCKLPNTGSKYSFNKNLVAFWRVANACSSAELAAVKREWNKKELSESYFQGAYSALTPPETPTSEDSRSLSSSPPLSPEVKDSDVQKDYPNGGEPLLRYIRENLQKSLPAELQDNKTSKNGLSQSLFTTKASSFDLTPPESPTREDSRSPSPPPYQEPFDVRSFKDRYSNGQPQLASYSQFSSALKHFSSRVFLEHEEALPAENLEESNNFKPPMSFTKENEYCLFVIDLLNRNSANELRTLANFEHGLTGKREGKSKLFGTWTDLAPQDTQT